MQTLKYRPRCKPALPFQFSLNGRWGHILEMFMINDCPSVLGGEHSSRVGPTKCKFLEHIQNHLLQGRKALSLGSPETKWFPTILSIETRSPRLVQWGRSARFHLSGGELFSTEKRVHPPKSRTHSSIPSKFGLSSETSCLRSSPGTCSFNFITRKSGRAGQRQKT
jgi:hypothetical protein